MSTNEPSYLAFARANVRDALTSSATIVRELVARIDRDATALKASQPRTITTAEELDALPVGSIILDVELDAWQKMTSGAWYCADEVNGNPVGYLPATVLYEPQS